MIVEAWLYTLGSTNDAHRGFFTASLFEKWPAEPPTPVRLRNLIPPFPA
jgi:hypothetical protein